MLSVLFLLVMDPLLKNLEENYLGPSLNNIYIGAFAHADNIRNITSDLSALKRQVNYGPDGNPVGRRGMAKLMAEVDWKKCLRDALHHQSFAAAAAEIASSTSLLKHWDMALNIVAMKLPYCKQCFRN